MADSFIGKVKGHVGEAKGRFDTDRREREAAGNEPAHKNIILTEREVRGEWDASRVLFTTLGGQARTITADDLATFRHNMRLAEKRFKGGNGITARQVIDLASSTPLGYVSNKPGQPRSDIDKARKEITSGVPVSARNGEIRFITNAGGSTPGVTRHHVLVRLHGFEVAAGRIAATDAKDRQSPKQIANWLRKQKLSFDCDCPRHRFFFRYVSTIGGFAAGRKETGYPKIRNPRLVGVACKHVLRVMTELESSNAVLRFLEKHLASVSEYKARTKIKQNEADEVAQNKAPARIKTSEQRKAEAQAAKDRRAAKSAARKPKAKLPKKEAPASRRAVKAATDDEIAARFEMPVAVVRQLSSSARSALEKEMKG